MNILLVRLRLIGDVVFTTPAIRAIRRHYPDARITYIVEEEAAAVVRHNPHLDAVIVARSPHAPGRLRADIALIRRLRRERYDLAIDFHGGPRSSMLTWLSGAPTRIGYEVAGRSWMYTTRVPRPRALRPRHSVVSQWDVLLPLGITPPDPELDATEMPDDPTAASAVTRRLAAAGIGAGNPIVVVHVSAGNPFRRWPSASFVELVRRLASKDPKRRIILTSGPSDAAAAAAIARDARARLAADERPAIVECGEFDLAELRALDRTGCTLYRRRQRTASYRRHDRRAGCGIVWTHIAGAIAAVSRRALHQRGSRSAGSAVPSLRSAAMRAR